jgi:hypothetical protein
VKAAHRQIADSGIETLRHKGTKGKADISNIKLSISNIKRVGELESWRVEELNS